MIVCFSVFNRQLRPVEVFHHLFPLYNWTAWWIMFVRGAGFEPTAFEVKQYTSGVTTSLVFFA